MKKYVVSFFVISSLTAYGMEMNKKIMVHHNDYQGTPITPTSLLTMAPIMPQKIQDQIDECMKNNRKFINKLVTTPLPLTHETRKQKTIDNFALLEKYKKLHNVENLSTFNYIVKFPEYEFTLPINRWGSRMACLIYATNQGNVLDSDFTVEPVDCSLLENIPSYQHCSRVAHYLRFIEVAEQRNFHYLHTTPTYLVHIPGKPEELSDENYVVIQEWVQGLKEIRQLPEREKLSLLKNITPLALEEIYHAIVYAALWDMSHNLAITQENSGYYMIDLEEPFTHKPQFFYFQGEEGKRKYVQDVIYGLEKFAKTLLDEPEQFNRWKKFFEDDYDFRQLCEEQNLFPNYESKYLHTKYDKKK